MESTRDAEAISIKTSEAVFLPSSTMSQINEAKNEKNIVRDDNSGKLSIITEAINETIAENNARSKEIMELFGQLDINPKSMPKDIQDSWTKVAAILRAEGLSEMDSTSLTICMERKKRETKKKAREERKLKTKYNELCDRHSAILEKQNEARNAVESLQKIVESADTHNEEDHAIRIFMATKLNDYRQTGDGVEEKLKEIGAVDYYPEKILEKYNTYLELMEELSSVDESLSKYGELPPKLSEAKVMVEEKERYLKDLEHALFEKMQ